MATYAKYLEKFIKRHEVELNKEKENKNFITDPHSYISFLELQIEKSSKAVVLTDALAERIDMMQNQINGLNEKISNTNKLLQIFETSKEAQEEEYKETKEKCKKIVEIYENNKGSVEKKINKLEDEMLDQSKRLNNYHRLLTEELNKSNDNMIKETERKINEYADSKISSQIQNLNEFKNNVDNFINVFSKDIQYDLKTLEKKIIASCKTNFLSKAEYLPKNQRYDQNEIENFMRETIEKSMKILYDDLSFIQKNHEMKFEEKKVEIEKIKQDFTEYLKENKEEINYLKKTFGQEFKNLNDCYLSGLNKIDLIHTEIKSETKKKRTLRNKNLKSDINHLKMISSQTFEKINRFQESLENVNCIEKSKESVVKKIEKNVKDSLNKNFIKINKMLNENSSNQNEIKNKMLSLENKTKNIQSVLKKKKKIKNFKRNHSLHQEKKSSLIKPENNIPNDHSYENYLLKSWYKNRIGTEKNNHSNYLSPTLPLNTNPYNISDIHYQNYSKEMGSDFSKEKNFFNQEYS